MRRVSEETKKREKRGQGQGGNYKPYIEPTEFNSLGTTSNIVDWKNGRSMQLLSQSELKVYMTLRWNDKVSDIREQYPLDLDITVKIAEEEGMRHPNNKSTRMTTDFFVTYTDGSNGAFSVKPSKDELKDPSTAEKLYIEKKYWLRMGVPYTLIFANEINDNYVNNIRYVTEYYDENKVFDRVSYIKHLIAHKEIYIDMESKLLTVDDFRRYMDG